VLTPTIEEETYRQCMRSFFLTPLGTSRKEIKRGTRGIDGHLQLYSATCTSDTSCDLRKPREQLADDDDGNENVTALVEGISGFGSTLEDQMENNVGAQASIPGE
jgi:hypothetical protein